MAGLVSGDGGADLAEDLVAVLGGVEGGVAVGDLGGALLEGTVRVFEFLRGAEGKKKREEKERGELKRKREEERKTMRSIFAPLPLRSRYRKLLRSAVDRSKEKNSKLQLTCR